MKKKNQNNGFSRLSDVDLERISIENPDGKAWRIAYSETSFENFLKIYFSDKFSIPIAGFHKKLFKALTGVLKFIAIMGFRGSAKSTIVEAFTLWRIVTGKNKFAVLIGATDNDSRANLANIRSMIEENPLLIEDFNIFLEKKKDDKSGQKWSEKQLNICGGTILTRSRGSKVRGLKFGDHRPDIVIIDDLEDTESTKTAESRKKTRNWFFSEVIPMTKQGALSGDVKVVIIGNYVHKDCLLANIEKNNTDIVKVERFALYDEKGNITWKALYPTKESVKAKKDEVMLAGKGMGNIIWNREYLLKIIDEEDQIIKEDDLLYYPKDWLLRKYETSGIGIDLAISKKQTADYTAMVKGVIVRNDYGERRLLILPNVVNEHIDFTETIGKAKMAYLGMSKPCKVYVEKVQYQQSAIEMMKKNGIDVTGVTPTTDKRARLTSISSYITSGMVLFPEEGAEDLITQLLGFGTEEHDDMVDAMVYLIDGLLNNYSEFVFA